MDEPSNPIAAVIHPVPHGYYSRLVAERPLYRDASLDLWVASSATAVTEVLTNSACRVRPADEPIPKALLGSPAAEIFRHLVRMNDGERHCPFKKAVVAALDSLDPARLTRESERQASILAEGVGRADEPARLQALAFALPVHVLGSLLGIADEELPEMAELVSRFVRCLAPGGTPEQIEDGKLAANPLRDLVRRQNRQGTLLGALEAEARLAGRDDPDAVLANAVGFLTQAYDATAGLITTMLLTLAREPEILERVSETPELLGAVVDEVLRYDSPVQNTRRFVVEAVTIAGQEIQPGETLLVVLAAANRDPEANPDPHRFDLTRQERQVFTFGLGPHACPGRTIATTIGRAAVTRLLANGFDPGCLETNPAYRPSVNSRIPLLASGRRS